MSSVDTNVLVRWLVDDDPRQSTAAQTLFAAAGSGGRTLFVPCTVMLELEWVLRSRYGYAKNAVLGAMAALLETRELLFQHEAAVEVAMHHYRHGNADFADCFHVGLAGVEGRTPLHGFDRRAARLSGVALLG